MLTAEVATPALAPRSARQPARRWSFQAMGAVLAESRPAVQLVFALRSVAGSALVRQPTLGRVTLVGGWALLTIAIYVFNGVTDFAGDTLNNSHRPIATGQLTTRTALIWCGALSAAGLALCGLVSQVDIVLGLALLLLGWAYSAGPAWKNHPAGFAAVIGGGAGLTYAAGIAAAGSLTAPRLGFCASLAAWVGLCCAAKDFSDVDGDQLAGRHTWPVILGARRAALLLGALAVVGSACVLATFYIANAPLLPVIFVFVGSVALAVTALTAGAAASRVTRRRPYRVFMSTQYATNVALMISTSA